MFRQMLDVGTATTIRVLAICQTSALFGVSRSRCAQCQTAQLWRDITHDHRSSERIEDVLRSSAVEAEFRRDPAVGLAIVRDADSIRAGYVNDV